MKLEKKHAHRVRVATSLLLVAIAILLLSERVTAGPAENLVAANNTNATITVTLNKGTIGLRDTSYREIPPLSTVTFINFLTVGVNPIGFEAGCVDGADCEQIIGTWKWDQYGTVFIEKESTLHVETGNKGKWYCEDGKTVVIIWTINNEIVTDRLSIKDNWTRLQGENNKGVGINATKIESGYGNCEQIIGTWKWDQYGTVIIEKESTLHVETGNIGKWYCEDGKTVVIIWKINNEIVTDRLSIKDNWTRLQGENNKGVGINATKKY